MAEKAFSPGTAGLIGGNVTARTDVEYDLANGVIRLFRTEGCKDVNLAYWAGDKPYSVIDLEPSGVADSHIRGWATVNGHRVRVIFDTGAATSMLELGAAGRAGVTPETPGVVSSGPGSGIGLRSYFENWIGPFDSFKVGDEEIRNTRLRFGRMDLPGADMLLGADFFLSHRIFVSRKEGKLYFTYNGGPVFNLTVAPKASTTTAAADAPAAAGPDYSDSPTDAAGFSRRAASRLSRGEYAAAIDDLNRAISLDPTSADYLTQRGVAHARNRQPARAVADLDQALKLKPNDIRALLARASIRLGLNNQELAKQDIAAADRLADKEPVQRLAVAGFYGRARMWRQSIGDLDAWIASFPKEDRLAVALNERCWARAMLGEELDKALDDCNAALRIQPGNPSYLENRALVHMRRGEFNRGVADYEAVLRLQPSNAWALYGRGWGRLKLGEAEAGEADIKAAAAIAPKLPEEAKQRGMGL